MINFTDSIQAQINSVSKANWKHAASEFCGVAILMLVILGCWKWAAMLGENAGYWYKKHPTTRAYLNFKADEKTEVDDGLKKASCEGRLMLLFQTKELVVVFAITNDGKFVEENSIFIVPRAGVLAVQIEPIESNKNLINKIKAKHSGACTKYEASSRGAAQIIQPTTASLHNSAL